LVFHDHCPQCKAKAFSEKDITYIFAFKLIVKLFRVGEPTTITVKNDVAQAMLKVSADDWTQVVHGPMLKALMNVPRTMLIRLVLSGTKVCPPLTRLLMNDTVA
jgi:hypothetical protein